MQAIKRGADDAAVQKLTAQLRAADMKAIALAMQGEAKGRLIDLISDTLRYRVLFKSEIFKVENLRFVHRNRPVFFGPPSNPPNNVITGDVVRNVAAYVALGTSRDSAFTSASAPPDIHALHEVLPNVSTASDKALAKALRTDAARIGALKPHLLTFPSNPFAALEMLQRCLVLTEELGVSGETLSLMKSDAFESLSRAAEDVFGAFRAKYPQEKTFKETLEPFEDKLRTRKRDGLVDFVVSTWPEPFADANKLYEYFLIDVSLEGCARTSRVAAGISSLQLYVHRVLMNLEKSADLVLVDDVVLKGVFARFGDPNKRAEWYWREHYRVWEANRKVFLYPENYIEPELRDDKTPLFTELEDTLLQQEINDSNVHDAYAKYLTGFDELAKLRIAGAYYQGAVHDPTSDDVSITLRDDVLHLFGVTQSAPPVYYYRTVSRTLAAIPRISAWQKLTLSIPVRKVSPILFNERLYLFWLETATRPRNTVANGASALRVIVHAVRIKYSALRIDSNWTLPQQPRLSERPVHAESRLIDDPKRTQGRKR